MRHDLRASQVDYLLDDAGKIAVDFVGRYESLQDDFKKVCTAIGLAPAPALPHIYKSAGGAHYSTYYDEESAEWVRERFARDIAAFGYGFEKG